MLSTIKKALSSFALPEEPQLLKRPCPDESLHPNAPSTNATTARVPYLQTEPTSTPAPKRQKVSKTEKFLSEHFALPEEGDDSVESSPRLSSPSTTLARRIRSSPRLSSVKRHEAGSSSIGSLQPDRPSPDSTLNHAHLIKDTVDLGERSLFPCGPQPDGDAVAIPIPSSNPSRRSLLPILRAGRLRFCNTLEGNRNTRAPPRPQIGSGRPRSAVAGNSPFLKSTTSFRTDGGEPRSKRRRLEQSPKSYVFNNDSATRSESAYYSKLQGKPATRPPTRETARSNQSRSSNSPRQSPPTADHYHRVKRCVQAGPVERDFRAETSLCSAGNKTIEGLERLRDSDLEAFAHQSKEARSQYRRGHTLGFPAMEHHSGPEPDERQGGNPTPPSIKDIFPSSQFPSAQLHFNPSTARDRNSSSAAEAATAAIGDETIELKDPQAVQNFKPATGKHPPSNSRYSESQSVTFPLPCFQYGFVPDDGNYVATISGEEMRFYNTKGTLSEDPGFIVRLDNVREIVHGSDDCLKLELKMTRCESHFSDQIRLEVHSREDKERLVEVLNSSKKVPSRHRSSVYMEKSLQHWRDEMVKHQTQKRPADIRQESNSKQQKESAVKISVGNENRGPTGSKSRMSKLTSRLQTSSASPNAAGVDSRLPTAFLTEEGPRQSLTPTNRASTKPTNEELDQARWARPRELRSAAGTTQVLRPGVEPGIVSTKGVLPRKYSQVHGLGEIWKEPLVYPTAGKRRMVVEYGDLFRLDEDEFLNDNLIGFFLRYLENYLHQKRPEISQKLYFYNSFFFERLVQSSKGKRGINYESVQKWTRNIDIFSHDHIILPVNENFHWYVVVVCNLSRLKTANGSEEVNVFSEDTGMGSKEPTTPPRQVSDKTNREGTRATRGTATDQTTRSLSQLSLTGLDSQTDELASLQPVSSSLTSPRSRPSPKKSGRGRPRHWRQSGPKHDVSTPMIMTFDPLGIARTSTRTCLRQYIVEEAKHKKGWDIDGSLIRGMTAKGIPTQSNFSDCGLYVCAYMEKFVLDPEGFVRQILQREMNPDLDMPMMPSHELRNRMRALILELHREQEQEESESPIPDVGKILLAPSMRESPGGCGTPQRPIREDSEDELQKDQSRVRDVGVQAGPQRHPPLPASTVRKERQLDSGISRPAAASRSDTAATVKAMLDMVSARIVRSPPRSHAGTRETAITIEDDDDDTNSPKKLTPSAKQGEVKADDLGDVAASAQTSPYFDALSESVETDRANSEAHSAQQTAEGRARSPGSAGSADTVNTAYLRSNRSYAHEQKSSGKQGKIEADDAGVVILVPDSQESVKDRKRRQETTKHEDDGNRKKERRSARRGKSRGSESEPQEPRQEISYGL